MRKSLSLIAGAALVAGLGWATAAGAAVVEWEGTLIANVGRLPQFVHQGTGVATVNGSAGGIGHISSIFWSKGMTFTGGNNFPETILLTGPENPTLLTLRATGLRLGPQTFNGISDGAPLGSKNTGRPPGQLKMCILFPGCDTYLPIPFGTINDINAVGVGGQYTINTYSKGAGFKVSMYAAPWTIGLASIQGATTETPNGGILTYTKTIQGFAHGPVSNTTTTAAISGLLQVVTPVYVETSLGAPDSTWAVWVEYRLHFIPEPGLMLLLGSGIAGLLVLGRSRMRSS